MQASHLSRGRRFILQEVFTDRGSPYFWEERFLPRWLPLLLGLPLGAVAAGLTVRGQYHLVAPLVLFIPALLLLLRYPFVAVILWMLALPLVPDAQSSATVLANWVLHRSLIPIALGLVVLSDLLRPRKRPIVRFGVVEWSMAAFLVYGLLNILVLHETGPRALIRFYDYVVVPFCLYALIRLQAPGERDLRRLAWVGAFLVGSQVAISGVSWFAPHLMPDLWQTVPGRSSGTLGSPYPYSAALTFASLLLLQSAVGARRAWTQRLLLAVVTLGFFGVFFSFQRTAWLGGALVLVGLWAMYPRAALKVAFVALLPALILGATVFSGELLWAGERLNSERTAVSRLVIYDAALRMIADAPLLGRGYGNYDKYDEQYKTRVLGVPADWADETSSHNAYLTILVELGVVGFALYALPFALWLVRSLRVRHRLSERPFGGRSWLAMLWLALLQQGIVGNFSDVFSYQLFIVSLWWMILGLIATVASGQAEARPAESTPTGPTATGPRATEA